MLLLCLFILFNHFGKEFALIGCCFRVKRKRLPVFYFNIMLMEDTNITLSCIYEGSIDSLYWYQQKPGSRPEFLIMIDEASQYVTKANPPYPRLSIKVDKVQKRVHLEISSAAVMDSAMHYCALRPTVTGNTRTLYKNPFCI
uniref:T-cell receptor alpha/delta variable 1 n=1 Tax=Sinocyclocheilus anshuiensis TaxID=1608454 RepID=A0A671Q4K4_9TELE